MDIRTLGICIICSLSVAAVCHGEESPATNNTAGAGEVGTTDLDSTSSTVQTGTQITKDQALMVEPESEKVREAAGVANAPDQTSSPSVGHEPAAPTSQEGERRREVGTKKTDSDCDGREAGGQCDNSQEQDTVHETEERLRASDQGFLSSRREKQTRTNYELALEHMLSSLLQFFPYPVVYVPISSSRNADYRGRSSGGSKSASTDRAEGRSSASEQAESLSTDTEPRTLPNAEKSVSLPDGSEGDAPRSRSERPKKCKSCSPASYDESPYYGFYAGPYYAPYDYYGYDRYETIGREGDYPYYYRSRNSHGGRYLGEFPDIHIGDTSLLHLRPARHQYEHRQYGSHYNHGMDRFFY